MPLRNIAYFEKLRVKKKRGAGKILTLTLVVGIASVLGASSTPRPEEVIAPAAVLLVVVYLVWILYLLFRKKEFALIVQTNAGDSPELFSTNDEEFMDDFMSELKIRLENGEELPRLVANIKAGEIHVGDVVMGDKIKAGRGSTVVNRSYVRNSFQAIERRYDEETARAVKKLADFIEQSGNQEAAELLNEFNKEAIKKEPRKSIMRTLWEGIKTALPTVNALTDVVIKIASIVA